MRPFPHCFGTNTRKVTLAPHAKFRYLINPEVVDETVFIIWARAVLEFSGSNGRPSSPLENKHKLYKNQRFGWLLGHSDMIEACNGILYLIGIAVNW